ncbi:fungal-specific transcription factor domain-containing protein [Penicillium malachiteum]|nr:fungal-specific transcription factor domain-containing protein [Penicillium malachiteum]
MQPEFIVCLRRATLKGLKLWEQTFSTSPTSQDPFHQVNTFFNTSSHFLLHLCFLYLKIPLMDLQEAIGKKGPENASKAFSRLKMWFAMKSESNEIDGNSAWTSDTFAMHASSEAIKLIELGLKTQSKHSSVPLSRISLFLSHVALWAIAKTAPLELKAHIPALVNPNTLDEASWTRLRKVLDSS